LYGSGAFRAYRSLPFALQKLLRHQTGMVPGIARSDWKLATYEQQERSATANR
jgi:hypothetical protein